MSEPTRDRREEPEFGPTGYLPERAAKRARKIVLRAPLGLQWVIASALVGVVLLVAALVFFVRVGGPPGDPYVAVATVEEVGQTHYDDGRGLLYVGAAGRLRAFVVDSADIPVYCPASRRLESPEGRVWSATGRALDGGPSLREHPAVVVDGVLYVDVDELLPPEPPEDAGVEPACF